MDPLPRPRLGELLVRAGLATPEQVDAAAAVHRANERTIGQQLLADGAVSELDLAAALSFQLDVPLVLLGTVAINEVAAHLLPADLAREHRVLVIEAADDEVTVAMADPADLRARSAIAERTGRRVVPLLALRSELEVALAERYGAATAPVAGALAPAATEPERAPEPRASPIETAPVEERVIQFPRPPPVEARADDVVRAAEAKAAEAAPGATEGPAVRSAETPSERPAGSTEPPRARTEAGPEARILSFLLAQALRDRATDVHIEPLEDRLRVRFRIDGGLREVNQLPRDMSSAFASRVRALAAMGRDERQGRLVVRAEDGDAAFDVSMLATLWGEKIVLRALERTTVAPDIESLGMESGVLERWRELLKSPYGLLLVAGLPGAGKTATLYASLRELDSASKDLTTVEDPIARPLDGTTQVPVDRASGQTFAAAVRAALTQEPDVLLVGELRDRETADVAMNAALAGRLILSSIQAPDALAAIARLLGLGADAYLASASLVAVLAQLLVRRLCEHCRVATKPSMLEAALLRQAGLSDDRVWIARGCARCSGTGYRGRAGVFELLIPNEELRSAIERGASIEEAREIASRAGLVTLRDAGLRLVADGSTSAQEILSRLRASG